MLSGISFFKEYNGKKYLSKIKSRLFTLVIPYLLWNTVWMLWEIFCSYSFLSKFSSASEPFELTVTNILKGIFFHGCYGPFWFMFNLIVFSLAAPLVFFIIRNKYVAFTAITCLSVVSLFGIHLPTGLFTKEKREAIKKLHMRAYFDSGDKSVGHHTWLTMEQNGIDRGDVCDKMSEFRNAIISAEGGKLYGSDIFYVESCVYLMTLYDLLSAGHKVWQVYDCFYSSGSDSQEWGQEADSEKLFTEMVSKGVKLNFEYFLKTYWG